jgi:hypothetical protein
MGTAREERPRPRANRGRTPRPRPRPGPGQIGDGDGDGDRGVRVLTRRAPGPCRTPSEGPSDTLSSMIMGLRVLVRLRRREPEGPYGASDH